MRVLIVDEGRERSSVSAARALASAGWTVGAGSWRPNLASRSRATAAWHQIAHTDAGDDEFAASLDAVVTRHGYDAVFVSWDRAVAAISERRGRLGFPVGYGPHDGVLLAMDKQRLAPVATEVGLRVPRTVSADRSGLQSVPAVVVKPASPAHCALPARSFHDPEPALRFIDDIQAHGTQAVVQELLSGGLMAVSLVAGPQGIVSIAQQVALKTWPQPVGITARGLSVPVDESLRGKIEQLLERLQWQGMAHLQFLVPADREPRLIDFNVRFYGSMPLAIRAGANHPDAWARVATSRPVRVSVGRPGARYQWFSRDLRASATAEHKYRETAACLWYGTRAAHNLWNWHEPSLAPRFLAAQTVRALKQRWQDSRADATIRWSAALHHAPTTPETQRALRRRGVPPTPVRTGQRVLMKAGRLTYEEQWLRPLQLARRRALGAAADGAPRLLVRVDEFPYYSGYDNPKFGYEASKRFHAVMAEAGVSHLMSVVPNWTHKPLQPGASGGRPLDDRDRELLEQMRADGVTFGQHGCTHRTRFANPRHQSELCGLDDEALGELIDRGRESLAAVGVHPRIFVPPFNRFDARQWRLLADRFDVVTGGPESVVLLGFHGGPQWCGDAIYLPCYQPLYDTAANVLGAVESLVDAQIGTWVPIVLHMGWEVDDDYAALRRLARRIAPYAASWEDFLAEADASRRR